ncbi:MAG: hypothetical protein RLZZ156_1299 [Deinococcota bacterium]|jgi:hypothetical protein
MAIWYILTDLGSNVQGFGTPCQNQCITTTVDNAIGLDQVASSHARSSQMEHQTTAREEQHQSVHVG